MMTRNYCLGKARIKIPKEVCEAYLKAYNAANDLSSEIVEKSLDEIEAEMELSEQVAKPVSEIFGEHAENETEINDFKRILDVEGLNELLKEVVIQYMSKIELKNNTNLRGLDLIGLIMRAEYVYKTFHLPLEEVYVNELIFKIRRVEKRKAVNYEVRIIET